MNVYSPDETRTLDSYVVQSEYFHHSKQLKIHNESLDKGHIIKCIYFVFVCFSFIFFSGKKKQTNGVSQCTKKISITGRQEN